MYFRVEGGMASLRANACGNESLQSRDGPHGNTEDIMTVRRGIHPLRRPLPPHVETLLDSCDSLAPLAHDLGDEDRLEPLSRVGLLADLRDTFRWDVKLRPDGPAARLEEFDRRRLVPDDVRRTELADESRTKNGSHIE